jgi:uncharacterized membrane protein
MQDADLFMELAAIAGVFVGFGALISVRSGGASDAREVSPVRVTVAMGLVAVIGALAPVTLGLYEFTEHQALAVSSVVTLAAGLGVGYKHVRSPEYRAYAAAMRPERLRVVDVVLLAAWVLIAGGVLLAPVVIVLGLAPAVEAALYFTVLVLVLLLAAWALLSLVFAQRLPESA